MSFNYKDKYLKYKKKYLSLKGGSLINNTVERDEIRCEICTEYYDNDQRRPVSLHSTVNDNNRETSIDHFMCLDCYVRHDIHHCTNSEVISYHEVVLCPFCKKNIISKICNYDENTKLLSEPVNMISLTPEERFFMRNKKRIEENIPELAEITRLANNVEERIRLGDEIGRRRVENRGRENRGRENREQENRGQENIRHAELLRRIQRIQLRDNIRQENRGQPELPIRRIEDERRQPELPIRQIEDGRRQAEERFQALRRIQGLRLREDIRPNENRR
jgi:hypothetical protein